MTDNKKTDVKSQPVKERSIRNIRSMLRQGPLGIPPECLDPSKRYVWEKDEPYNMHYRLQLGYVAVTDDRLRAIVGDKTLNEDTNNRNKQIIRTGKDGVRLVLMEIDRRLYEEYKDELAKEADDLEARTLKSDKDNPNFYGHSFKQTSQTHDLNEE